MKRISTSALKVMIIALLLLTQLNVFAQCVPPSTILSSNKTQSTATIEIYGTSTGGSYYIEYGLMGFVPGTGATPGAGGTLVLIPSSQNFIGITGLTPATFYDVYSRKNCSGVWGANSVVHKFITAPNCSTAPIITCNTNTVVTFPDGYGAWTSCTNGYGIEKVYSFTPTVSGYHVLYSTANTQGHTFSYKPASSPCDGVSWTCISNSSAFIPLQASFGPLVAGTTYHILADNYTSPVNTNTFRIECPYCAIPTNVQASNITPSSATITWTGGSGVLEIGPVGFIPGTGAAGGGGTVYPVAGGSYTLNNLNGGSNYDVYVRASCGGGNYSPNSQVVRFYTNPCPLTTQYPLSYIGLGMQLNLTGYGNWTNYPCGLPTPGQEQIIQFTPPVTTTYDVYFAFQNPNTYYNFQSRVSNGTCNLLGYQCHPGILGNPHSLFLQGGTTYDFLIDVADTCIIPFCFNWGSINIKCPAPLGITANDIQPNSLNINWVCSFCSGLAYVEYGPAGFTPGTGATAGTNGTVIANATSPVTITGLTPYTSYDVYVRTSCGGYFSSNSLKLATKTSVDCAASPLLSCGTHLSYQVTNTTPTGAWQITACGSGNNGSGENVYRFTPTVDGMHSIFVYKYSGASGARPVKFYYKTGNCSDIGWTCIGTVTNSGFSVTPVTLNFGPLTNGVPYMIFVDGLNVSPSPFESNTYQFVFNCPNVCSPPVLSGTSNITTTSAVLNAPCSTCFGDVTLEYGPAGFTPGNGSTPGAGGTIVNPVTFPVTLSALTAETTYDAYARVNCGVPNGYSANTTKVSFTPCSTAPTSATSNAVNNTICAGGSVTLTANGAVLSPSGVYKWYTGGCGGTLVGTGNPITLSPTVTTSYTVRVESSCGVTSCVARNITVSPAPTATITPAGPTTFCPGGSVTLNANTGSGLTHQWKLNGTDIPGATTSSYIANQAGAYTVVVTNTCASSTSAAVNVVITSSPTPVVTAAGPTSFCLGGSVVLNSNTASGWTYQWKRDGVSISGATGASVTATLQGSYTVTVTNTCLQTGTSSAIAVTVFTNPVLTILGLNSTYPCVNPNVTLTGNPAGGTFSGPGITGNIFSPGSAGIGGPYTITYNYTDGNGCSASVNQTTTVTSAYNCAIPQNVNVTNLLPTSVKVNWQYSSAPQFQVRYRKYGTNGYTYVAFNWVPCNTFYQLTGLKKNTTYLVSVRSQCTSGNSAYSPEVQFTTPAIARIADAVIQENVEFYPNPVSSTLNIQITAVESEKTVLKITDLIGKTVLEQELEIKEGENVFKSDLSNLNAGVYVVSLRIANRNWQDRFVKE